jgi:hypothetical protein
MDNSVVQVLLSAFRAVLMAVGAGLVTDGLVTNDQLTTIVSGVVTAAAVIWSLVASHNKASALKDARGK